MHDATAPVRPTLVHELADPGAAFVTEEYVMVAAAFLAGYRNLHTRTNYGQALKQWFVWCRRHELDPLRGVKRAHIELWLRELEELDHRQPSTVCGKLNALVGYYKTAVLDDHLVASPATYARRPRVDRISKTNWLTRVELLAILEMAAERNQRDHAIFCLLGLNGLRSSEVVSIDIEALGSARGQHILTVLRKGERTHTFPLSHRTWWALEESMEGRRSGPLFLSLRTPDKRLTRSDLQRLVKRYARWCGITKRISPHSFRHSFVTLCLDAGANPRDVQNSSNHLDPRMMTYYDRNRESLSRNTTTLLTTFVEGMM